MRSRIFVTVGAGFIGSAVVRYLIQNTTHDVANLDKLTYAGILDSLISVNASSRYRFYHVDICQGTALDTVFAQFIPTGVMHVTAESHVGHSIDGPPGLIQTNIVGTYSLLEATRRYWSGLSATEKSTYRAHHISTDEVHGDLEGTEDLFTETTPYSPS